MKLLLKRIAKKENYTIGKLYINGLYFSDTLEDKDRGLTSDMTKELISKIKVKGKTAIPTGTYKIDMNTVSPRFKNRSWAKPYGGKLPRLIGVPGYEGVLIHVGNSEQDSEGCVLTGKNTIVGKVTDSLNTFKRLMTELLRDKNNITITIQ